MPNEDPYIDAIEKMESPRLFKSHLPVWFMEESIKRKQAKCIVIMRNPKDMLVSYYHFACLRHPSLITSWDAWFEMFRSDDIQYGNWFDHVTAWWKHHRERNFLFITYEGLKLETRNTIERIASFIGVPCSKELAETVIRRTSFDRMRKDPASNLKSCSILTQSDGASFIRKGKIGGWENYFTVEQNEFMDQQIAKRLTGTGLEFIYNEPQE